nr:HYR domain-containing protein [Saprospiraceae bacterium]
PMDVKDHCGNIVVPVLDREEEDPLGNGVVLVTYYFIYTDCAGNATEWKFVYTVEDTVPPTIVCPEDLRVDTDPGECFATGVDLGEAEANDNCGIDTIIVNAPDTFELGQNIVIYIAYDLSGNTDSCEQTITVEDNEDPVVICPDDIVIENEEEECQIEVDWDVPVPTDNCGVDTLIASHMPGDTFPVGMTDVTYIVIDESGNSDTCTFTIEVLGADSLTITCPADILVENDTTECGKDLVVELPEVSGGCGMLTITNDFNNEEAADGFYPVGTTMVTYTVTDENGNEESCEFTVTVEDTEDPVILNCPEDIVVGAEQGECSAVVEWSIPSAEDNCPGVELTSTHEPGDTFEVGTTVVVYTAEDASGNTVECSFEVVVEDNEAPSVVCPDDIIVENEEEECEVEVFWDIPEPTDNCVVDTLIASHQPGDTFPIGITEVTYIVIDGAGNADTCSFFIEVLGGDPLTIECPADILVENDATECGADLVVDLPEVNGGCGMLTITNDFNPDTTVADGFYPVGTTTVTYTVTDENDNMESCEFTVTVEDTEDPVILDCPGDLTVDTDSSECSAIVEWMLPTAEDNCPGVVLTSTHEPGDTFALGTIVVTYTATDASGNSVECTFEITVEDNETPEVICPDDIVEDNLEDECEVAVTWNVPVPTDNCGVDTLIASHEPGDTFPVGITEVMYIVIDESGNSDTCTFTIEVLGADPLTIVCPADIVAENDTTECGAYLTVPLPTVSGGCGMLTITNDFNPDTTVADGFYPVGTTTVTYTVMDENGHPQDCQFTVTVNDTEDPVIIDCPADIVLDTDPGECSAVVTWTIPTAEDNCFVMDLTSTHESGDTFEVGVDTVFYTAIDSSGNSAECSFVVVIEDGENPVFTFCPADTTVSCHDYEENLDLSQFGEAEAEDNCLLVSIDEVSTVDVDTCTQTGTISREFTVTDDAGNTATCEQIITFDGKSMLDSLDFIWPDTLITVEGCVDFHVDSIPDGSAPELNPDVETCNEYTVVNDDLIIESDTMCDQILRTWIVTDECHNTVWEFEQILTVEDTTPPEFINVPDTLEFYLTEDSCEIFVNLDPVLAEDQCGFEVNVTNNSPFSDSTGADASGVYPVGTTDFSYFAENHCGVVAEFEFTIIVLDTITPDINCVKEIVDWGDSDTLVVSIFGGIVSASDNCTDSANLIITLDINDPGLDSLVIPCDSLNLASGPDGHTLFDYWIYAIDEFGNIDSCKGSLRVDHNEVCFSSGLHLNGSLFTFSDETPISNSLVFVESGGDTWETTSDEYGFFEFLNLEYREDMWLKPLNDDDPLNGVTTFDIFLLQRHILGIDVITNPYYLIAGDVNNDGRLNILDIAELRRLILGTYNQFPNNTSWRFLDADFIVPYGVMPTQIDLPESVLIEPGIDRFYNKDFVGIKIGDLNGNAIGSPANPQHSMARSGPHPLEAVDRIFKAGEVVTVDLRLTDMNRINGIQFELLWDSDYLNIQDVVMNQNITSLSDIYNISYRDEFGSMALSVSSVHPIAVEKEDFIVEIQFTAIREGVLSEAIKLDSENVVPEVFDGLRDLRLLELVFVDRIGEDGNRFELFQNRPNPFTGNTLIPFVIPSDGETTLQLFNVAGKLIWNTRQNLPAGKHQFELDAGKIGLTPGVYYYQLSTGNHVAVKKMVVN